jgi:hypothetical protein
MKDFFHPGTEDKVAVDLNRALEGTITVSRNEWKYVAEIITDLDPALPLVHCLPQELNQVFLTSSSTPPRPSGKWWTATPRTRKASR